MKNILILVLASIICLFSACSNPVDSKGSLKKPTQVASNKPIHKVTVKAIGNTMAEMAFDLKEIKVPANSRIELSLINDGTAPSMLHNIVFVKYGTADKIGLDAISMAKNNFVPDSPDVIAASALAKPRETVKMSFDAPAVGQYQYLCTYPGHHKIMRGVLTVTP